MTTVAIWIIAIALIPVALRVTTALWPAVATLLIVALFVTFPTLINYLLVALAVGGILAAFEYLAGKLFFKRSDS